MILNDAKSNLDDILEHHGTKGMKWGVRKGKGTTGITRTRGALVDRNDRRIASLQRSASHPTILRNGIGGSAFLKTSRGQQMMQKKISKLEAQNNRVITGGKLNAKDRLKIYGTVSALDLVVSVRPRHI